MEKYISRFSALLALSIEQIDRTGTTRIYGPSEIPIGGLDRKGPTGNTTLEIIIRNGITIILVAAIVLSLFFLLWGGIQWITSSGDKNKVDAARKKILYAVVGLLVVFFSFIVVRIIGSVFGIDIFCIGTICRLGSLF